MSAQMRPSDHVRIDVSKLPETAFGHRSVTWWATVAFMTIEGTTLVICATAWFYLRINSAEWPPRPASAPELLVPTISLAVLLLSVLPMALAKRAALRFDLGGVRRWLSIASVVTIAAMVMRWFDFQSLNVRWDSNAYGSAVWAVVFAHTTLLVADVLELVTITAMFYVARVEPKHFSDVEDGALYQYFLAATWVVLYVIVFLGPRVL